MKKVLKDRKLYIFFLITLLFFSVFIKCEFATDSYAEICTPIDELLKNFLQSGRIIVALCAILIKKINMDFSNVYLLSYGLAIFAMTLAQYKLYNMIINDIKNEIVSIILSCLIIINPFSIELFLFVEKGIMTLSVLLCVCAVEKFKLYMECKNKKNFFYAILYMMLAIFCYQGTAAIFVMISAIFIIKQSNTVKDFVKNTFLSLLIYGVPGIINYSIVKFIYTSTRVREHRYKKNHMDNIILQ